MIKKIVNFIFLWIFVPLTLIGFWIGASLFIINPDIGFTALRSEYGKSSFLQFKTTDLFKGEMVSARFKAVDNNLGTVSVRFNTLFRDNYDWLIFRIKEEGQDGWYYENRYKVDQFQPDALFPFGFPIIKYSKNKTYYFVIESTEGESGNAIAISPKSPIFLAKYQFSRLEIMSGYKQASTFIFKKIINSFNNFNFFVTSLIYLFPLLIYILLRFSMSYIPTKYKKNLTKVDHKQIHNFSLFNVIKANLLIHLNKLLTRSSILHLIFYIYGLILVLFILFNRQKNGLSEIILLVSGIFILRLLRTSSKESFGIALGILVFCPFLFAAKFLLAAENAALWAYIFLVIGTAQAIWELRSNKSS